MGKLLRDGPESDALRDAEQHHGEFAVLGVAVVDRVALVFDDVSRGRGSHWLLFGFTTKLFGVPGATTCMAFSDRLLAEAEPVWAAQYDHPFVTELADGSLDPDAFRHWVEQDYRYLLDYADVFSLAATKASDEARTARLAETAHRVLADELDLHRGFAADYGLSRADLEAVEKAPTCQAYTDHLVRAAREAGLPTIAAAVYPCGQGYLDVADHAADLAADEHRYTPFVEKYTSDAFRETVAWLRDLVDDLAEANPGAREDMRAAFHRSARLEHDFWEMAYTREDWSVGPERAPDATAD